MRTFMWMTSTKGFIFASAAVLVAGWGASCSSEKVYGSAGCTDPCCNGNSNGTIDCAENPNLSCTEKGDACTANEYGCRGGAYYLTPPSSRPAGCPVGDAGSDDGASDQTDSGGVDAETTAIADSGTPLACGDASCPADSGTPLACGDASCQADSGALFACGDASCASESEYCKHTSGGAPPGVDFETCEPLPDGQSICSVDAAGSGCTCDEDAGGIYVTCNVP
jgi:hypothetical protein